MVVKHTRGGLSVDYLGGLEVRSRRRDRHDLDVDRAIVACETSRSCHQPFLPDHVGVRAYRARMTIRATLLTRGCV